jgi:hypothetical protein
MSVATCEIYRTESGSLYEASEGRIRKVAGDGSGPLEDWTPYVQLNRLPAALLRPGTKGEILEIVLGTGKRVLTSRLVPPFLG